MTFAKKFLLTTSLLLLNLTIHARPIFPIPTQEPIGPGPTLLTLEDQTVPLTTIIAQIRLARDEFPNPATTLLLAEMLDKGSKDFKADDIAKIFESKGAAFQISSDDEYMVVSIHGLSEHGAELFSKALEILTTATFPQEELDTLRSRLRNNLFQSLARPQSIAERAFSFTMKSGSLYAPIRLKDLESVTRSDLQTAHKKFLMSTRWTLGLASPSKYLSVQKQAIREGLKSLDPIPLEDSFVKTPTQPKYAYPEGSTVVIEVPEAAQTIFRCGVRFPGRKDLGFYHHQILAGILGGFFESRLMQEVRKTRGLAYSAWSYLEAELRNSFLVIGTETKSSSTKQVNQLIRTTLGKFIKDMSTNQISPKELLGARETTKGGFDQALETSSSLLGAELRWSFYGLDLDLANKYAQILNEIKTEEFKNYTTAWQTPLTCVIVGNKASVQGIKGIRLSPKSLL